MVVVVIGVVAAVVVVVRRLVVATREARRRPRGGLLLLADRLDGGLGDLAGGGVLLGDRLDDADGNRLPHVADGEPAERRVSGEWFHGHGLGRSHLDDGGITVLDGLGEGLQFFAGTTIASGEENKRGMDEW